jgi:hypothetical protein
MTEQQPEKRIDQAQEGKRETNQLDKPPDAAEVRNATASDKQAAFASNKQIFRSITDVLAIPDGVSCEEAKARQVAYEQKPIESFGICFDDGSVETVKGIEPARKPEQGEKLAIRDDYLNRERQKPTPHDGQTLTLKQLFEDYKTPFMDAYERSRNLKNGEPGKSKTLEEVVDRLKDCPWTDQITIRFDSSADNTEYRNTDSAIVIRPQDPPETQIENFAHEGYHATHQFLSKLYEHGKQTKQDFVNIWLQGEVNAMLTETRVFHELGLNGDPPKFSFIRSDGKPDSFNIEQYVKANGEPGLREFLRTNQPGGRNAVPYGKHYADFYDSYISNFERNEPAVEQYINRWVRSGNSRGDI